MNIIDALPLQQSTNMAFFLEGNQFPMTTNGPLANAMAGALDQIYKREIDPATGIALETQQMDEVKFAKTWVEQAQLVQDTLGKSPAMIYGVYDNDASPNDIIDVSSVIWRMDPAERLSSVVIVENGADSKNPAVVALEALCQQSGVGFYSSFSAFVNRG